MTERALAQRIEETCLNAWPALLQVFLDDWLLRVANGLSRRANSANPLRLSGEGVEANIAACEALYQGQGLPAIFRIPSTIAPVADRRLERQGYLAEGESLTLYAELDAMTARFDEAVELTPIPTPEWLASMGAFQGRSEAENLTYARIVGAIAIPAAFAAVREDGDMAALAYGALHDGLLCYESVITGGPLSRPGLCAPPARQPRRLARAPGRKGRLPAGRGGQCAGQSALSKPRGEAGNLPLSLSPRAEVRLKGGPINLFLAQVAAMLKLRRS